MKNTIEDFIRIAGDLEATYGEFSPKDVANALGGDDWLAAQAARRVLGPRTGVDTAAGKSYYVLNAEGRQIYESLDDE